jgi:hypothetical protein
MQTIWFGGRFQDFGSQPSGSYARLFVRGLSQSRFRLKNQSTICQIALLFVVKECDDHSKIEQAWPKIDC